MEITIRDAKTTDRDSIALLLTQLGYPSDSEFAEKSIETYTNADRFVLVAESDDTVTGFLSFSMEPAFHKSGNIGSIMALAVLESMHGKGIGSKLVRDAERRARAMGCVRLAVASGVQRLDAHRFYLGLGFEERTKRFVKDF